MRFDWDLAKAAANKRKHGVTFEEAATVFDDSRAIFGSDELHPDRMKVIAFSSAQRLLLTVYSELSSAEVIRIISARPATRAERKRYENQEP